MKFADLHIKDPQSGKNTQQKTTKEEKTSNDFKEFGGYVD
jgi:hypothetical protein